MVLNPMLPTLSKSYINRFPFRLATTSFIYPDTWSANARALAPFLDEVELTFFESAPASLPTSEEIDLLCGVSEETGVTYHIHLPIDLKLGDRDPIVRTRSVQSITDLVAKTRPLNPAAYTVHLDLTEDLSDTNGVEKWVMRTAESLDRILETGISPQRLAVENLNYPLAVVEALIEDKKLSICLDIGHLHLIGDRFPDTFDRYENRISILHLCGVGCRGEHLSLDQLPDQEMDSVVEKARTFLGTVSLEVFSIDHLLSSLNRFESAWMGTNTGSPEIV